MLAHPRRREYVETGRPRRVQHPRVVVDEHHDGAGRGERPQGLDLVDAGRPVVVERTKQQLALGQVVAGEPVLGDPAQPLGPAGEVDDVVDLGQRPGVCSPSASSPSSAAPAKNERQSLGRPATWCSR